MIFLSDAVIAIAMTMLAFNLELPEDNQPLIASFFYFVLLNLGFLPFPTAILAVGISEFNRDRLAQTCFRRAFLANHSGLLDRVEEI